METRGKRPVQAGKQ